MEKLTPEEKHHIFEQLQSDIKKWHRQRRIRIGLTISAAACVALFTVFTFSYFSSRDENASPLSQNISENTITDKDIQLVLANSQTITFEKDAEIKYEEKEEIIIHTGDQQIRTKKEELQAELNTLIVPRGKRSSLLLADGTKVWINSGSILKFPTYFNTDKREIWVEGEIYLEVEKNTNQPMVVHTSRMTVDVIGTQFSVIAYTDETEHSVVLVEGKVNVNVLNDKIPLLPNQKLSILENEFSVETVYVSNYTSWTQGYLQFNNEPLSDIVRRLSRYYNVSIVCESSIAAMKSDGKLVLFDDIKDVLETISNTLPVKYSFEDELISVQKR